MTTQTRKQIPTAAAGTIGFLFATLIFAFSMFLVSMAREESTPDQTIGTSQSANEVHYIEPSEVTRYLYVLSEGTLSYSLVINPGEDLSVSIDSSQQFVVSEQPLAEFPNPVVG
jgi:hypothetical protein